MSTVRYQKLSVKNSYILLAIFETLAMLVCLFFGMIYGGYHGLDAFAEHLFCLECLTFVLVVFVSMAAMGLYHARLRGEPKEIVARILLSFALASVAQAVLFYFIPYLEIGPRTIALSMGLSFIIVCLLRYGFSKVHSTELLKKKILVIGAGEKATLIAKRMRRAADRKGFRVAGFIDLGDCPTTIAARYILPLELSQLSHFVEQHQIDEVVVAADQRRGTLPMDELYRCRIGGTRVIDIATFIERESGKVPLTMMHPSWLVYSAGYQASDYLMAYSKRGFDIAVSLAMLMVVWPLMLLAALLITLESGSVHAPVFYTQIRVGRRGQHFKIYKFRSMSVDAEKSGAVWASKNDSRVTAVGAYLRKYRIDELPQLYNILKGDMSFVGPRPERPEFVDKLSKDIPYYGDRHQVKPGLTGWAQICYAYGSDENDAKEKLQYDLYYIKNYSFLLDTIILIQTAEIVFFGKGAR